MPSTPAMSRDCTARRQTCSGDAPAAPRRKGGSPTATARRGRDALGDHADAMSLVSGAIL
jgi:hypothetical protein